MVAQILYNLAFVIALSGSKKIKPLPHGRGYLMPISQILELRNRRMSHSLQIIELFRQAEPLHTERLLRGEYEKKDIYQVLEEA